jgi:uncharacterized protein YdaU (DUF1376 family)
LNYYERHIGDYLKDTAHLSLLEHGVYTRLLDVYYTREGGIPADQAARLVGARSQEERDALEIVLREFFVLADGVYQQTRCEREIERFRAKSQKAKESINKRWEKVRAEEATNNERTTDEVRTLYERTTNDIHRAPVPSNQSPVTSNQTPDIEAQQAAPPEKHARPRGTRLSAEWTPDDELFDWAKTARPDLDMRETIEMFRDYWHSKPGKDGVKLDWSLTFRNWVRAQRPTPVVKKAFDVDAWARQNL